MRLFKKRVRKEGSGSLLTEKIAVGILSRQRKWADYLNARVVGCSFRSRLFVLVVFCLISGSYLIYLLISSIF